VFGIRVNFIQHDPLTTFFDSSAIAEICPASQHCQENWRVIFSGERETFRTCIV